MQIDERVVHWLLGECEHPVTGQWFERPEGRKGAFWWRTELWAAIQSTREAGVNVEIAQAQASRYQLYAAHCPPNPDVPSFNAFLGDVQRELLERGFNPPPWPDTMRDLGDYDGAKESCVKWCADRLKGR